MFQVIHWRVALVAENELSR